MAQSDLDEFIAKIPRPAEIKNRLNDRLREVSVLKQLLHISEQREKVEAKAK